MLQWLLILPALVACWMIQSHYLRRVSRASPIAPRFLALSRRTSARTRAATLASAVTCAGAMVFALARPQAIVATRDAQFERQDLIIVLDRSVSMRAHDIAPSRLVRATSEIRNFLQHRPDAIDRVALVGFAASSLVLSYPTADMGSLFFYLDWIDDDASPLFGTNMGGALIKALALADQDPRKTQKLFLLISDAASHQRERGVAAPRRRGSPDHDAVLGVDAQADCRDHGRPIRPLDERERNGGGDQRHRPRRAHAGRLEDHDGLPGSVRRWPVGGPRRRRGVVADRLGGRQS